MKRSVTVSPAAGGSNAGAVEHVEGDDVAADIHAGADDRAEEVGGDDLAGQGGVALGAFGERTGFRAQRKRHGVAGLVGPDGLFQRHALVADLDACWLPDRRPWLR